VRAAKCRRTPSRLRKSLSGRRHSWAPLKSCEIVVTHFSGKPRRTTTRTRRAHDTLHSFDAMSGKKARARKQKRERRRDADAGEAIPRLPDHLVVEHVLRTEHFDDPADLARLPAVSRAMRGAVAATGLLWFEELDEHHAVELGCLSVLKRLQRGGRLSRQEYLCQAAARSGHLEELKVMRENGCPWDRSTCWAAARGGHLEVLQWARANGCPWDKEMCTWAAEGGHLEVLQWARANGCTWDEETCAGAAEGAHIEVLQWLRANGCPWDHQTCWRAAAGGHLEVLQWARANGCPWDGHTRRQASAKGHHELLKWAIANGCPP
jgi:hypothetical protein